MNAFQKAGTFLARIAGATIATLGAVGPVYAVVLAAFGQEVPEFTQDQVWGSAAWIVLGSLLAVLAAHVGRLLGRGLD